MNGLAKIEPFGIEVVDFRIKRINYVEEVRRKVYERMIAERNQISQQFRSEGMGESKKIEGEQEKELRRIQSEAYRTVEEIKGKADAEATASVLKPTTVTRNFIPLSRRLIFIKKLSMLISM